MSRVENLAQGSLVTQRDDEQSCRTRHKSHSYHDSHQGIPKGLKLVPEETEIRFINLFACVSMRAVRPQPE